MTTLFFFVWEARKQPHPSTADRVRGGGTAPQIHMQVGPHSSRCRRKGPQGATPRTRPPAPLPLGRRPQAAWSVHCTTRRPRTLVPAPSIKRISSSNPEGPLRDGCRRPAPPSTLGLLYLDPGLSWLPPASRNPIPACPAQRAARLATVCSHVVLARPGAPGSPAECNASRIRFHSAETPMI